jgi:hypothetical protein
MEKITITLHLPADLAQQAQSAGLLTESSLILWLRQELERRTHIDAFFNLIDQLAALEPPLTPEEIAAEIAAYRHAA